VKLEARIKPPGNSSFEFTAEGKGINLTTLANPVTVALIIGNDTGKNRTFRGCALVEMPANKRFCISA
jgi:hypothetical protein